MRDFNHQKYYVPRVRRRSRRWLLLILSGILFILGYITWRFIRSYQNPSSFIGAKTYEFSSGNKPTPSPLVVATPTPTPSRRPENLLHVVYANKNAVMEAINQETMGKQGKYGWYVQSLVTGETYGSNFDFAFTAASVNKVPIILRFLLDVEAGSVSLSDTYRLNQSDIEGGSGGMQYQALGTKYTYKDVVENAGKHSDNTAVNFLARITGKDRIQRFVDNQGMTYTSIKDNTTSPKDMGELFSSVYLNKILKKTDIKQLFLDILTDTDYEDRIPLGVPENVPVVHKIGNQIQVWNDCGLVLGSNPYSLCILTDGTRESEAQEVLPRISHIIWEYESIRKN